MIHALASPQAIALAVPIVGWSIYRRVHRNIARQPLQPRRLAVRGIIVAAILAALMFYPRFELHIAGALLAGCAFGIPLGIYGVRLTRFETTPAGQFYQPNLYLGIFISLIFVVRMAYRCIILYPMLQTGNFDTLAGNGRSPLTYATLGLVLGHFAAYYIGVILAARRNNAAAPTPA